MRKLFMIFFFLLFIHANSGAIGDYQKYHKEAYELIISMRINEAIEMVKQIKKDYPEDVLIYHIENYIDFITIFISEEEAEFRRKEPNKDIRISKLKSGNPDSPLYLFTQAEIHLQWALTRIKFKEYFAAAREVNKAIKMLEENEKRFPNFISNKKSLSILHAVAGTLPDKYRGVVSLVTNFSGTIDQGAMEIEEVLDKTGTDYIFRKEAEAIKAMIMLHLQNRKNEAWNYLSNSMISKEDNPMAVFLMASTAMNCGLNEKAIQILKSRTRSPRFYPFYYLDLMLGSAKLYRLDRDSNVYLTSYIKNFNGQDYFKDTYRKLAWYALAVTEDKELYLYYMSMCLLKGSENIDEDRSAQKEAESNTTPHLHLLKARLLFDGGYLEKALTVLENVKQHELSEDENVEFFYRKGRVNQNLGKLDEAIYNYASCLNLNQNSRLYYRCNSAFQLGIIYEIKGNYDLAENYFETCLSMNPSEYKNSIHQKAKAGIIRIKQ